MLTFFAMVPRSSPEKCIQCLKSSMLGLSRRTLAWQSYPALIVHYIMFSSAFAKKQVSCLSCKQTCVRESMIYEKP